MKPQHLQDSQRISFSHVSKINEYVNRVDENSRLKLYRKEPLLHPNLQGDIAEMELDLNGFVTEWSRAAEKVYGWDDADAIGKHISLLYLNSDLSNGKVSSELRAAEHRGAYSSFGWQVKKNGQQFWSYVEIQIARDAHGTPVGFRRLSVATPAKCPCPKV